MAYQFNGSNQNLRVNSAIVTNWPFTLSCFFKTSSFASVNIPLCLCGDGSDPPYYYVGTSSTPSIRFGAFVGGSSGFGVNGSTTLSTNVVYHLTAVFYSDNTAKGFVNGVNDGTASHGFSYNATGVNRVSIGVIDRQTPILYTPGEVSEAAIWNAALTDAEILSLARGFTADQIRPQSLVLYPPLVRDLIDLRGGRTIVNVNSATVATHPRIIT